MQVRDQRIANLFRRTLARACYFDATQSGDASAGAAFDLGKLESYTVAPLKQFCKDLVCPIKSSTRKVELQKALRAWVAAKEAEGHIGDEDEGEEEVQSIHNGIVGGPVLSWGRISRAGSSVSSKALTLEVLQDRQAERAHQLELMKMRMTIEEKKLLLAHELSLRELDQRCQSSRDGGSNITVQPERMVHIPKDLVKDYKREDDILLGFKGSLDGWVKGSKVTTYEGLYNLIAWEHLYSFCFPELRQHLIDSKLTDPRKLEQEEDLWESTRVQKRSLDGWVKGSKVTTYEGLYNLIAWEHLYSFCFPELRQHLIDSKLTDPRKLEQEEDLWESTRGKDSQPPSEKKPWFFKGKPVAGGPPHKCYACDKVGHVRGDPKCPKSTPAPTGAQSQGLASVALGEELVPGGWEPAEITLVSLGDSEMVQRTLVPENTKKYRQWVTINGQRVEALRDTGASVTTVRSHLVSEEQIDPRVLHQVVAVDNSERLCRVAQVPFEWGGV
ncbi:hypothetical protein NDU88_006295 [Pleurodeles waltl]|uniref:Peptidase A2 domain-containing protein n=1 Tax=Pleurodeles waltl TaxID=8319 RepID=A0AAV7MH39_PLEWA|nr:hypothetical protein NDU88_006295 [Pleurodeles waltl]